MKCLGIPLDHRLLRIIRNFGPPPESTQVFGDHVKLLYDFGDSIFCDGNESKKVPFLNMEFSLQLARPEVTGGVLVLLLHPDKSQNLDCGYLTEAQSCTTIRTILELIEVVNNGCLSKESVSIFDSMPFMIKDYDSSPTHRQAQSTFLNMVIAKKPEVVISCFSTDTHLDQVRSLRKRRIGQTFDPPDYRITTDHQTTRVSAFHPSFAMNRVTTESCFRRLLMLEFAHSFGIWRTSWEEEEWMEDLRRLCQAKALEYTGMLHFCPARCRFVVLRLAFADYSGPTLEGYTARFRKLTEEAHQIFLSIDYFRAFSSSSPPRIKAQISDTNLSWLLCDAALVLKDTGVRGWNLDFDLLEFLLDDWCSAVSSSRLIPNRSSDTGYFDHRQLLLQRPALNGCFLGCLQMQFMTFLRQLNLSYTPAAEIDGYFEDVGIQADAFEHFAHAIEELCAAVPGPETDALGESMSQMTMSGS